MDTQLITFFAMCFFLLWFVGLIVWYRNAIKLFLERMIFFCSIIGLILYVIVYFV